MADWDADDFEPEQATAAPAKVSDKWDGEDEEDDVKVCRAGLRILGILYIIIITFIGCMGC